MSAYKAGSVLDGKYEILERLGAGGMGEVFRVRHVHLHEQRVIKILRQDKAADPTAIQRFSQEARIATQIKHPNVAILYDFSRLDDGSFYMVWEHIEGEDVGTWLRAKGPFPIQLAVELGIQGLRGLEAIHSAGVIHRDISPDNLMITRDVKGRALLKIIDLGLAKNLSAGSGNLEITQAGMFMGKLMYCSPEQAGSLKEGAIDHRSDLYSYGAVLYEMVCGLPPSIRRTSTASSSNGSPRIRCRSPAATRRCGCPRSSRRWCAGRSPATARPAIRTPPRSSTAWRGSPTCCARWRPRSCRPSG
ncbi:MAG: serine/threonine protein kinase [Thermoanaerobaculia bacterium]|nr:serine/threonine protein kinase [Thermoanaerobaculia bacterium]